MEMSIMGYDGEFTLTFDQKMKVPDNLTHEFYS